MKPIAIIAAIAALPFASYADDHVPAGDYKLDRSHASLLFRVSHMGFSHYTARFKDFDAQLHLDPSKPEDAKLNATVQVRSLETDFPYPEKVNFNAMLQGEQWLDAAKYPTITYRSTGIELTKEPNSAIIHGELTLHGVTKPMALQATYNGGYPGMEMDPNARIGFSAHGTLKRSDYGVSTGIPAPGSNMGVGDEVEVILETEFSGPAWKEATAKGNAK